MLDRLPVSLLSEWRAKRRFKILIVRLSAIGDIVMASGLINAIKQSYPNAEISWLCEDNDTGLLAGHKDLQQIIPWPKEQWKSHIEFKSLSTLGREIKAFSGTLKRNNFDLVLDTQGLLKSSVLGRMASASTSIVIGGNEGSKFLNTYCVKREKQDFRMSSEYRDLAQFIGCADRDFGLSLPATHDANDYARDLFTEAFGEGVSPILVAPFTTRPQKHWIDAHWAEVFSKLVEQGYKIGILGAKGDFEKANALSAPFEEVINLAGKTSLNQIYGVVKLGRALIGVDTGITHMGIASQVPTVAIFGSTCPYKQTLSDNSTVIYTDMACSPCHRRPTCNSAFTCMTGVTAKTVLGALNRHLV